MAQSQVCECRLGPDGANPGYDAPVPEKEDGPLGFFSGLTAREAAVGGWDLSLGAWEMLTMKPVKDLAWILWYGNDHGRMAHRVKQMDVEKLVELWTDTVVQLSTCHTHAERTEADAKTDDLLGPILTAPIKQVRRFAELLADRLEADERVPFLIWSSFRRITLPIVKDRPAGAAINLRKKLAREVAELVDRELPREDLVEAMVGALQWRPEGSLRKVRGELEKGAKPKIRGRESCLFLEAGGEEVVL